ncbi:RelA/SpoT domain-containing protein [Pontibacter anaerobius]|uniref:RelA/SpoT domain-containing protein n=1 Tax=Pontibacter anaerobius TaxID=2993940 RepID=A0ABT3RGN3_9BACT|nr:RelA/SpoT domain-containing protein [Pontibacter anaerobius]MCX2740425.1 RelA/SpoT domain-containing protein [Pontibacter anaerobius]
MRSAGRSHKAAVPFILAQLQVSEDELRAQGLEAKTLTAIYNDYTNRLQELEDIAQLVTTTLRRQQDAHAVRHRVKEPLHLLKKIIRKKKEYPDRHLDVHNYLEYINDLVGVRTLHLYKEACHSIGEYIQQVWELKRTPYAYVSNEQATRTRLFAASQYNVIVNDRGYEAQHFILKVKPNRQQYLVEVQVKTLLEEGWSEIDHCIRYPDHEPNELLNRLLWLLGQFTMKADAVASQIQALAEELHKYNHPQAQPEVTVAQLRSHIEALPIDEQEKQYLYACLAKQTGT